MAAILFIHIVSVSVWLGCVLVEGLFERAADASADKLRFVGRLHWRVDLSVEIPAFALAAATGAILLRWAPLSPLLEAKIGVGLAAILMNVVCAGLVYRRMRAGEANDFVRWRSLDRLQHRLGALVFLGIVVALVLGGWRFDGG